MKLQWSVTTSGKRKRLLSVWLGCLLLASFAASGCARVLHDEVGVKRKRGRVDDKVYTPGWWSYNPFNSRFFRLPTRTVNLAIEAGLPSREGLTIQAKISILYRVRANEAPKVFREVGLGYEQGMILPVFRSASSDVCARYDAKTMHSAERAKIESAIRDRMDEVLGTRGFEIEAVLLKSIELPAGLARAIENKLEAEQEAQRMTFLLNRQRSEAERRIIEAEAEREVLEIGAQARGKAIEHEANGRAAAIRIEAAAQQEANKALQSSLTDVILRYHSIQAFRALATSPNAKTILTDGKTPVFNIPSATGK